MKIEINYKENKAYNKKIFFKYQIMLNYQKYLKIKVKLSKN